MLQVAVESCLCHGQLPAGRGIRVVLIFASDSMDFIVWIFHTTECKDRKDMMMTPTSASSEPMVSNIGNISNCMRHSAISHKLSLSLSFMQSWHWQWIFVCGFLCYVMRSIEDIFKSVTTKNKCFLVITLKNA